MSDLFLTDYNGWEVDLCPLHGAWYAKGCARCVSDLDAMSERFSDDRYAITDAGRALLEGK